MIILLHKPFWYAPDQDLCDTQVGRVPSGDSYQYISAHAIPRTPEGDSLTRMCCPRVMATPAQVVLVFSEFDIKIVKLFS